MKFGSEKDGIIQTQRIAHNRYFVSCSADSDEETIQELRIHIANNALPNPVSMNISITVECKVPESIRIIPSSSKPIFLRNQHQHSFQLQVFDNQGSEFFNSSSLNFEWSTNSQIKLSTSNSAQECHLDPRTFTGPVTLMVEISEYGLYESISIVIFEDISLSDSYLHLFLSHENKVQIKIHSGTGLQPSFK